jgi:hypothetical protein
MRCFSGCLRETSNEFSLLHIVFAGLFSRLTTIYVLFDTYSHSKSIHHFLLGLYTCSLGELTEVGRCLSCLVLAFSVTLLPILDDGWLDLTRMGHGMKQ